MAGIRAAKRYAKGLMQFANETSQADMLNREMIDLKNSIQASRELSSFSGFTRFGCQKKGDDFKRTVQRFLKSFPKFHRIGDQSGKRKRTEGNCKPIH